MSLSISIANKIGSRSSAFSPLGRFAGGVKGAWFAPWDLSTLWQDAGATTPVTADGQTVALMQDKSGNGLHLTLTNTIYNTSGGLRWLTFNGTSSFGVTSATDLTGGDALSVFAAVRKDSAAALSVIAELSTAMASFSGTMVMLGPIGASNSYGYRSRGTVTAQADVSSGFAPNDLAVLAGQSKISTDTVTLRRNGTQVATSATDQGTGNYGNRPLYIGARAGTSAFFTGRLYEFVMVAEASTAAQVGQMERYLAQRNGVTIA